jgi:hypothetical protein
MSLIHRCQQGFTTVTLMGVLLVGGLLVGASFAAVDPDISLSREDQDSKQAYGAAEAGVQWYLSRLVQDNSFYVHCTNVTPPSPTEQAPVNQAWNGVGKDPRRWRSLPGGDAQYTVELIAAPGFGQCVEGNQYSMIDANGNLRLRVSGKSRGEVRTVLATLRRQNFLDFIYFTDYETLDPGAYSGSSNISKAEKECVAYRDARTSFCTEITFPEFDDINGPLHTNDSVLVCGKPNFGRTSRDAIEIVGDPKFADNDDCSSNKPNMRGTLIDSPSALAMPPSNSELVNIADANYRFTGKTTIELIGDQMKVWNADRFGSASQTMAMPPNGVISVTSKVCTVGFTRQQTYPSGNTGCGDVWLKGSYSRDLTISAANDIVIYGDLKRDSSTEGALLGLVANNFVRVYHPVSFESSGKTVVNGCRNRTDSEMDALKQPRGLASPTIDAAILGLRHSFIVDNWYCGQPMGDLHVFGAIAQRFRGPVGTHSGSSVVSGYTKDYWYNDRLRYREPPYFLDPVQASWRLSRETEQERPVMQR